MFRTVATIAVVAFVGFAIFRVIFGVMGGFIGLLFGLAFLVFKALVLAGIIYFILSMVAPDTARKVRVAIGLDDTPQA
jgi:uncharacterized membrane protein